MHGAGRASTGFKAPGREIFAWDAPAAGAGAGGHGRSGYPRFGRADERAGQKRRGGYAKVFSGSESAWQDDPDRVPCGGGYPRLVRYRLRDGQGRFGAVDHLIFHALNHGKYTFQLALCS